MHSLHILPLALLLAIFTTLVSSADFGSCHSDRRCGFICCADSEECVQDYCVGKDFVSTALLNDGATSKYPSLTNSNYRSSIISALESSGGVSSVYEKFRDIMTDAPSPSPLGTEVPSGVTIPSSLPTGKTSKAAGTTESPSGSKAATPAPTASGAEGTTAGATAVPTGAAAKGVVAMGAVLVGILGLAVGL
ncbi:hypothetical protein K440DRAFT_627768 [Wilcoxina mikolae CBS 423.85]|nr:hypothetical protein K440DRAFT_627768 [Wilcoxina mikolae CBS 423.85]